jgi:DNA-binding response OmpR family regulator
MSMKPTIRVLFADDDPDIRGLMQFVLHDAGMQLFLAENGQQALKIWHHNLVDVVVLDIMMPLLDGLSVCRRIRRVSDVPIILLTAKGQEQEVVEGLEAGADDYIVKPFRPRELVARLQAGVQRLDRRNEERAKELIFEDLRLDASGKIVVTQGRPIQVTPLEFRLLQYLMQNIGVVFSKEDLFQNVWGYVEPAGEMNLIEAAIRRLRKKIEADPTRPRYIQTVWGAGYRFGDKIKMN